MTIADNAVRVQGIAFVDLEASGLGSNAFPTELGWAIIGEGGFVESGSCLIRPPPQWNLYRNAWSAAAERLTGITREMLDRDGLPPREVMKRVLDAVGDRDLFSDERDFDSHWFSMLADAEGTSIEERTLGDARKLIEQMGLTIAFDEPPRHRAEADARRLALAFARALTSVRP